MLQPFGRATSKIPTTCFSATIFPSLSSGGSSLVVLNEMAQTNGTNAAVCIRSLRELKQPEV